MVLPGILLASNSPRRRELIALGGWKYTVIPADIEETQKPKEKPSQYVLRLAETKARAVASQAPPGWLVVAADTIVVDGIAAGAEVLEKPVNPPDAFRMLAQLRSRSHQVLTALGVLNPQTNQLYTDLCSTLVTMRTYHDDEIAAYIASGEPMDKAGAYAIQDATFHPVSHLEGCYASVMGLPLCHLQRILSNIGFFFNNTLPPACQAALKYQCPDYSLILATATNP
jgi:septum formation protein